MACLFCTCLLSPVVRSLALSVWAEGSSLASIFFSSFSFSFGGRVSVAWSRDSSKWPALLLPIWPSPRDKWMTCKLCGHPSIIGCRCDPWAMCLCGRVAMLLVFPFCALEVCCEGVVSRCSSFIWRWWLAVTGCATQRKLNRCHCLICGCCQDCYGF